MRLLAQAAERRLLWLDHLAYSAGLPGGAYAWLDAASAVAGLRRAQALLRSDVVELPLAPVVAAWLDADPALREALAAKSRQAHGGLKELLGRAALRGHLAELALALRAACRGELLALVVPSPRDWLAWALGQAGADPARADDEDAVDSAAACMADLLRAFASSGVDVLALRETRPWFGDDAGVWGELLQPLANVARHYGWDWGTRLPAGLAAPAALSADFVIVPAPGGFPGLQGIEVDAAVWSGGALQAAPAGCFDFASIPAAARPEDVLACLDRLRNA